MTVLLRLGTTPAGTLTQTTQRTLNRSARQSFLYSTTRVTTQKTFPFAIHMFIFPLIINQVQFPFFVQYLAYVLFQLFFNQLELINKTKSN